MIDSRAPSEPVQLVLDRLNRLGRQWKWATNQYLAQCPAHDDHNPSLAVREGAEGAIVHCHAGCTTEAICDALAIRPADLFARTGTVSGLGAHKHTRASSGSISLGRLAHVADYLYEDERGIAMFKVARFHRSDGSKTFRQYHRNGQDSAWILGLNGSFPPLYHLPRIQAAITNHEVVMIVEGEKDADAALEHGIAATTAAMGAGKWRPEHSASLRGANVVILADDDPPGWNHALTVYAALEPVASRVQLALPPEGCKDLSEALDAGHHPWAVRFLSVEALRAFATGSTSTSGTETEELPQRVVTLRVASSIAIRRVRWGWEARMPVGEMTLVPGREGIGKSLLLAWMAAQLTRGTLPGEFAGSPRAVLYAASEDSFERTIVPRMMAAGADLDLIYLIEVQDHEGFGARLILPKDCAAVTNIAIEVQAAALMLDPIVSLIDERLSVNQSAELRRALEPLRRCAEETDMMVPALAHFNKAKDTDVLSKIPGARAWAEVARAAFGVARDDETGTYVGSQIKNNLGSMDLPHLTYEIEVVELQASDGLTRVGKLVWTGESDTGVSDLLNSVPKRDRGRPIGDVRSTVIDWVEDQGRPVSVNEVAEAHPDITRENIRQLLSRASRTGTLRSLGRGLYERE